MKGLNRRNDALSASFYTTYLTEHEDTLAVFDGQRCLAEAKEKGVLPLYRLVTQQPDLCKGAIIADKVTGRAAAALTIVSGAAHLYTDLISESALALLQQASFPVTYGKCVPRILNRKKDGPCPMEHLVRDAQTPEQAVAMLTAFFQQKETGVK